MWKYEVTEATFHPTLPSHGLANHATWHDIWCVTGKWAEENSLSFVCCLRFWKFKFSFFLSVLYFTVQSRLLPDCFVYIQIFDGFKVNKLSISFKISFYCRNRCPCCAMSKKKPHSLLMLDFEIIAKWTQIVQLLLHINKCTDIE
jgi:hypothetical protein